MLIILNLKTVDGKGILVKDENYVLLFDSIHESKHALNIKYNDKLWRVIYKDEYVVSIEPLPLSEDTWMEKPNDNELEEIFEMIEEFFNINPQLKGWE